MTAVIRIRFQIHIVYILQELEVNTMQQAVNI